MDKQIVFKKYKNILFITLTAVFSALCFAVLFLPKIYIPSPVGKPYIHFGNLIIVLVALLFGGPMGAISGAIGMGAFDLIDGYGIWTIKTVILKAIIGISVGLVYRYYNKHQEKNVYTRSLVLGSLFSTFGIITLILSLINNGIIKIGAKEIALSWPLYVFSLILGAFLILVSILSRNKNNNLKIALYASTFGIVCNVIGEFAGKIIKELLSGQGFVVSVVASIASLPATIINGTITVIVVMLVYPILKRAVKDISLMKDENDIEEIENE